ncbi:hypothetical protein HZF24_08970 [Sedimentibacter hydroxybenzoicus DSM 7310]|uniref:SipW-cognate class signal peptide n=1 Tax=Sedimentibacter hydroxybenzoicus DSM 7310 TaxID=1123245 RepID=A0A974GWP8_SEDHY|nr:hypothetical protein [Sedimentibacter hydroxybenzoicus]NYB74275.1 hypothetical protein [Sedimentibacter hydroxybenzoicus DSM 7310]
MKKTKLIALIMVISIMMVGAGYAAWSEQIFVDTTIKTGNFNMEITKATVRTGERQDDNLSHEWHHFDWTKGNSKNDVTINQDGNSVEVELRNLYPGGVVQFDMTTTNNGTIPAKLKSVNVQYLDGNKSLLNSLKAKTTWKVDINGDGKIEPMGKFGNGHVDGKWHPVQSALSVLVDDLNNYNIVIEPKGSLSLGLDDEDGCIQFKLDENAKNALQDQTVKFKLTFNWEQWTTDPNSNPYTNYGGDGDIQ